MGLFTGLALGALAISQIRMQKKLKAATVATDAPLAPGPVEGLTPPKPPVILPGADIATAQAAGAKQRKKSARGSILARPKAPLSAVLPVASRAAPRSLIGY